jgi:hypothetical protein
MNLKKTLLMTIAAGMTAFTLAAPAQVFAEEAPATEVSAAEGELTPEQALDLYKQQGYLYTSNRYGFSIVCPYEPTAVIPASMLDETAFGEILIFESDGYDIKNAWTIQCKAFEDSALPADLAQKSEKDQQAFINGLMEKMPYEFVRLADVLGDGKLGIYAVTAKDWEVDENGDGKVDGTLHSDTQTIRTFFRGQLGGNFAVELIDNPELTAAHTAAYRLGLQTFKEIPVENPAALQDKKKDNKKK